MDIPNEQDNNLAVRDLQIAQREVYHGKQQLAISKERCIVLEKRVSGYKCYGWLYNGYKEEAAKVLDPYQCAEIRTKARADAFIKQRVFVKKFKQERDAHEVEAHRTKFVEERVPLNVVQDKALAARDMQIAQREVYHVKQQLAISKERCLELEKSVSAGVSFGWRYNAYKEEAAKVLDPDQCAEIHTKACAHALIKKVVFVKKFEQERDSHEAVLNAHHTKFVEERVALKRNKEEESSQFRVRPWPLRGALRTAKDYHSDFATMQDCIEANFGWALFDDESWLRRVWMFCHGSGSSDDFTSDDATEELMELEDDMRLNDEWRLRHTASWAAERMLIEWLMEHDLDALKLLIDEGLLTVGNELFDPETLEWQSFSGGQSESLLAIAAKHLCLPKAVHMLLACGADPNAEMVHLSFNGGYVPTCGPGGLAWSDVRGYWHGYHNDRHYDDVADKINILTALAEAGGEMFDAWNAYERRKDYEVQFAACDPLWSAELARASQRIKDQFETVVALVGIVSFWRRAAAAPDSKAAKAAIARAVKRARG